MGAGVSRGLQNRCGGLRTSWVGSIPTYSRQKPPIRRLFLLHRLDIPVYFLYNIKAYMTDGNAEYRKGMWVLYADRLGNSVQATGLSFRYFLGCHLW